MVSDSVIRKAREIVNRGDVEPLGFNEWAVTRKDKGTTQIVIAYNDRGTTRFASTSQQFKRTGRDDTYIQAVRLFTNK